MDLDPRSQAAELTVGELISFLAPERWRRRSFPPWPPDVFAISMALLLRSGAYCAVVDDRWPPRTPPFDGQDGWPGGIRELAGKWRAAVTQNGRRPPLELVQCWRRVVDRHELPLSEVQDDWPCCCDLLTLLASADEACEGVGLLKRGPRDRLSRRAHYLLRTRSTAEEPASLCLDVHPSRLVVLPKLHTPQAGLTARSLSHHLAVAPGGTVSVHWYVTRLFRIEEEHAPGSLNFLVLPWPKQVAPADFRIARPPESPRDTGLFRYDPRPFGADLVPNVRSLVDAARRTVGSLDGVIFPELALTEDEFQVLSEVLQGEGLFLVSGIRGASTAAARDERGFNYASISLPLSPQEAVEITQYKHHRWRLDRGQIRQYGLGSRLDPTCFWWEDSQIERRRVWFVGLTDSITACILICEDLARLEPVSEVLRAVGPNLVIALLMDGPQLGSRWPSRYATILADDPGSSVLTVTSLGMAQLSRSETGERGSRVVALWKDDKDGRNVPIELPEGADGLVLSLARERKREWTADNRPGAGRAYYPTLVGIHAVSIPG